MRRMDEPGLFFFFHFIFPAVILIAPLLYRTFTDGSRYCAAMHQIQDPLFNKAESMFMYESEKSEMTWHWRIQ